MIGGSAGIGLETARLARAEGADVILTGRNPERLERRGARGRRGQHRGVRRHRLRSRSSASSSEPAAPIDHVLVTGGGPYYAPLAEMDFDEVRRDVDDGTSWLPLARRPLRRRQGAAGGTLLFIGGTGGRRRGVGLGADRAR